MKKWRKNFSYESIKFHGRRNDFSRWLYARSLFELATGTYRYYEDFKLMKERKHGNVGS